MGINTSIYADKFSNQFNLNCNTGLILVSFSFVSPYFLLKSCLLSFEFLLFLLFDCLVYIYFLLFQL